MRVLRLSRLPDLFARYDLDIQETRNFIANGMIVHNTSAHVAWRDGHVTLSSGGENAARFAALFDIEKLTSLFTDKFGAETITVYGEAYGGKCQRMSATYGKELRFVAFEVRIDKSWLSVPKADECAASLGLDFVPYAEVSTDIEALDAERDRDSEQAIKNGIGAGHKREGIVLRPLLEVTLNNGNRVIAKHKRAEFQERASPNVPLDPSKREMLESAQAIADEWVTAMRLTHVLDSLSAARGGDVRWDVSDTGAVIHAMVEDVCREAAGEIRDSKPAHRAIGSKTARMYKTWLDKRLVSSRREAGCTDAEVVT